MLFALLLALSATAAPIDQGFRGLQWGEALQADKLRGTCRSVPGGWVCDDEIRDIPVEIFYIEHAGIGFHSLSIGSANRAAGIQCYLLLDTLEAAFGKGKLKYPATERIASDRSWLGTTVMASWEYNQFIPKCTFRMYSREHLKKYLDAEKSAAQDASREDL